MKCNYKQSSYLELTIPQFLMMFPDMAASIAKSMPGVMSDLVNDADYIVRVASDGRVEFGYKGDKWNVGA